jgi:hypothetical protein
MAAMLIWLEHAPARFYRLVALRCMLILALLASLIKTAATTNKAVLIASHLSLKPRRTHHSA